MSAISFKTELFTIGKMTILQLPQDESAKLPSRGQVMVEATINGHNVKMPLEPDGKWSHWLEITPELQKQIDAKAGDTVSVSMTPTKEWFDPEVPTDLMKAVNEDKVAHALWQKITPMARWEWVRWTRATSSQETRDRRIKVAISKMNKGERRPCCWNRNLCTDPSVFKNGVLLEPATV